MANPSTSTTVGKYCLTCFYDLRGLTQNRCPECGRSFDPDRPMTFSRQPHPTPVRDLVQRVGKALEQALAPDDPDGILARIRASGGSHTFEIERLRRANAQLRVQLDFVLDVLVRNGLAGPEEVARLRASMDRATAHPIELVEHEAAGDADAAEEEGVTPELLDLQRAARERDGGIH